jgi:hypothetical protein
MALVPDTKAGKVAFYKSRLALWTENSVAIGSSAAEITELSALVTAAEAEVLDQDEKHETARSATLAADTAVAAMDAAGATVISGVRHKARTAGDVVYTLANIPAPAIPGPRPAPGKPEEFTVELQANGALTLKWKCANPPGTQGTMYMLWRRIGATGNFEGIGGSGDKMFVDSTLPAGTASVTYQIQAVRSTAVGPWAQYTVNFGVTPSGTTTSVAEGEPVKIAA